MRKDIKKILDGHIKWLCHIKGGKRADLSHTNLISVDLSCIDLQKANLSHADLRGANLYSTNLSFANLYRADFRDAILNNCQLYKAINIPKYVLGATSICPEGTIVVWKKLCNKKIAKLEIASNVARSNATGRKCRAASAKVLAIYQGKKKVNHGRSLYDYDFVYEVGKIVKPSRSFDKDRWNECGSGIHFFLSREEAELP